MVQPGLLLLLVLQFSSAAAQGVEDLTRARTKKPGDAYRGTDQTTLSRVLNGHLQRGAAQTRPCEEWSTAELQEFMATVAGHRSSEFQEIYEATQDRRKLLGESMEDFRGLWRKLNSIVDTHPHLLEVQRESHCRQAVMWWVHHLTEDKRGILAGNVSVPLLPEGPKKPCGRGEGEDERSVCAYIEQPNSCDWCHSTQAAHDAGVPGTSVPDALNPKYHGPDDGNPKGWDRKRRCDQDQMPRCQLCEGIGGRAWSDVNEDIDMTTCEIVARPNKSTVAPPFYPKAFTVKRKDGQQGGYSDTLIGWKTDPFCFGFFPQNDSIQPLCYRSQDAYVKYYDIEREAARTDYNVKLTGVFSTFPNTTATILQVNETMWIQNHLWVVDQCICANPSGNHCTKPPCKTYVWHWDTFKTAQYLGREKIGVEWIQNHGTGASAKQMELDHFILWTHHVWTDPISRRPVRMWKPFNGLQCYDPEAWTDAPPDPSVFESPPAMCKKGGAKVRIHCDDDGNYDPGISEGLEHLDALYKEALSRSSAPHPEDVVVV
eukprot:CAMPEP_0170650442 /NCGR_PEP_ID=MMETSP0224-20130122/45805_1 /TAXON_ID=285029 /ORGANISM="Togula jolla, Strain CCCM 725" /LENGTH=542 /DNA_ID=CAMNT_0010982105 /DNA_START=66 /DNA_END=1694 /DNA_ORIENTATION=+